MTWGFNNHVIDVHFDKLAHYMAEDFIHQSLISCFCVFQAERHDLVKIVGVVCDEGSLVHVGCGHWDLVVSGVCI